MIKNYLLTAFRNILRHKSFSLLNILGLALSLSVCLLIIQIIQDQMSYDVFHQNRHRIYRVQTHDEISDDLIKTYATTTFSMGTYLKENYPAVENVAVLNRGFGGEGRANGKVLEFDGFYVSEDFFSVFDLPIEGIDPEHALENPNSVILTEETARKFFGDADPLGQTFAFDTIAEYIITGIIPEMEHKSHIQFDAITSVESMGRDMSEDWNNIYSTWVYLLLAEGAAPEDLNEAFELIRQERYEADPERDYSFELQALMKICPGPLIGNEIGRFLPNIFIYFMVGLAFLLILSSAFNYTNMSLAKALTRAKEIGVRKVTGAKGSQIFTQFLTESVLAALLALVLAYIILQFLAPAFQGMRFMSELKISLQESFALYIMFFIFTILAGVVAGLLPAGYISRFNPIAVIKDTGNIRVFSRPFLRKFLVVAQFTVSIILIITIVLAYRQLHFYMNTDYGFQQENVLNVELQKNSVERVRTEFSDLPEVQSIAWSGHIPAIGNKWTVEAWLDNRDDRFDLAYFSVDQNYLDVLGLKLVAGADFPENLVGGQEKFIILNGTAVNEFGFASPESSLGEVVTVKDSILLEVIGVVEDYHYFGMFSKIGPMGLRHDPNKFYYAHMLISSPDIQRTMRKLEKAWEAVDPEREFKAVFMNEEIRDQYLYFTDILYMIGFACLLAVIIACMGLFGMAAYNAESRIKEIGIRKSLGATGISIAYLVSRSYIKLIFIALILALPLSWFGNNLWLQNFHYRVSFGFGTLFFGSLFIVLISFLTIISQTMKAARRDPVNSLRYE